MNMKSKEEHEPDKNESSRDIEHFESLILENKEVFESMITLLKRLKEAGITSLLDNISKDYMPTDVEFFGKFFTSKEFTVGMLKTGNLFVGVMHALSNEKTSDTIKALLFNAEGITDAVLTGAKNPEHISLFKLYSMIKDPDVASGLTAILNVLKFTGKVLKTVENQ